MSEIISFLLDIILSGLLLIAIVYAAKLYKQLLGLRSSRTDMERFVVDFSNTVHRAEAGVRGLKHAARESGDDLEKLIEKAQVIRDELHFLVESADKIATRISDTASSASRSFGQTAPEPKAEMKASVKPSSPLGEVKTSAKPTSTGSKAEQELRQALEKLG